MNYLRYYDGDWRFAALERGIRLASGEVIEICSEIKPRRGARAVTRRGEDQWQISPTFFDGVQFHYDRNVETLYICGAPSLINEMIDELVHARGH